MVALALTLCCAAPAAAQAPDISPGISPPGANDWSCHPTSAHPYPVVLGAWHVRRHDGVVEPDLAAPEGGRLLRLRARLRQPRHGPIEESAPQLRDFVDRVLAATGARKVSLVGHSQGGMMPRY